MSTPSEMRDFVLMMDRLSRVYAVLPNKAATLAVNFSKERFRAQNWVDKTTQPWKKRKFEKKGDAGRAILVKTAKLKRDVHKIAVGKDYAIIGTSKLTGKYAKAHNEGFRGSVMVKAHTRNTYAFVKEKYTSRSGRERSRTRKTVNESGAIKVKAHLMKMNLPRRKFLGVSAVLDKQIERMMTAELIRAIK